MDARVKVAREFEPRSRLTFARPRRVDHERDRVVPGEPGPVAGAARRARPGGGRVPLAGSSASASTGRSTGSTRRARQRRARAGDRGGGRYVASAPSPSCPPLRPGRGLAARRGVGSGDPVVLMLGNQVELWESMLAVIKLGAVIMPTTTAVGAADLVDRIARGRRAARDLQRRRHRQVRRGPGDYTRSASASRPGWADLREADDSSDARVEHPGTRAERPAAAVLHLRHDVAGRSWWSTPRSSYPVGHLSTMYWLGLQPGRRPPEHLLAGVGQARLVVLLRAVDRRGDGLRLQLRALRRGRAADGSCAAGGHHVLRPADGVADAHQRRPVQRARLPAGSHRRGRAAQPRGDRAGAAAGA